MGLISRVSSRTYRKFKPIYNNMPRSKRDKKVALTKVDKKVGLDGKNDKIKIIKDEMPNYKRYFTFSTDNTRNQVIRQLRLDWANDSHFFFTKRSLIRLAFGEDEQSEVMKGLAPFGQRIRQEIGLLMTNKSEQELRSQIDTYNEYDFARAGTMAVATVIVKEGKLTQFAHSQEPYLRTQLEMPVKLDRGIIHLLQDVNICRKGDTLTGHQCRLLKYFEVKLAEFRMNLDAMYEVNEQAVIEFKQQDAKTRALEHLTYNKITLEDGDYDYKWIDEETDSGVKADDMAE